jgi:hypothetical protein
MGDARVACPRHLGELGGELGARRVDPATMAGLRMRNQLGVMVLTLSWMAS